MDGLGLAGATLMILDLPMVIASAFDPSSHCSQVTRYLEPPNELEGKSFTSILKNRRNLLVLAFAVAKNILAA